MPVCVPQLRTSMRAQVALLGVVALLVGVGGCSEGRGGGAVADREPVVIEAVEVGTPAGVARGYIATIDLADPRVHTVVTRALPEGGRVGGAEAVLRPVDVFAREVHATVAVNANYFAKLKPAAESPKADNEDGVEYLKGERADVLGLSVSDGVVVSPERGFNGRPDPALVIVRDDRGQRARAGYFTVTSAGAIEDGVAGIGGSSTDTLPGTLLVENGQNLGATARVEPGKRHPRTAAGVSADGRTLVLAAIDGRQKDWSVGLTLPELADLMIGRGCVAAVNLDGGGSTTMVRDGAVINRPSDGKARAVANALAVVVEDSGGETNR